MVSLKTQTIGYPHIGRDREMKRALEAYWRGRLDEIALLQTFQGVEEDAWETQYQAGIDYIGVGDATLYDQVLDWAIRFGFVPARFRDFEGLERYFAMARGRSGIPALEMTKWFDTNYHYLVPEVEAGLEPRMDYEDFIARMRRARAFLGEQAVPIILGPVTLLRLSRLEEPLPDVLLRLLPLYVRLLRDLRDEGFEEVQLHEPALVLQEAGDLRETFETTYARLAETGLQLNLVTFFDDLGVTYDWVLQLPVHVLTLDFTRGENAERLEEHDWPAGKVLAAGVVDGRNVWRMHAGKTVDALRSLVWRTDVRVSASCPLQFVPYSTSRETHLPKELRAVLAFADEKLTEIVMLAVCFGGDVELDDDAWVRFHDFAPSDPVLEKRLASLGEAAFRRGEPYTERRPKQVQLPLFPTTTIGSFPQIQEVRRLRGLYKRGQIDEEAYDRGIDGWIAYAVGVQEGLGLDVLVHGEFERSDMVEYFAEKLTGFAFTQHGWVQSYGSRYVRPPIIYADVTRTLPLTVREFEVAQSFTPKPVKGMLTGPVTILNWSFPRDDLPCRQIAFQIALALREEVKALEAAGARVVQVDEPALREGLPFKRERWDDYLTWAVDAFRLATAVARPETQVHTHMCYAEFGDILGAIERMDADVISLENARSGDEPLRELAESGYGREIGPGVYDVHSPVVPSVDFVAGKLRTFLRHLRPEQIWVNPDCGLKTRGWAEVIPSLRQMVEAARRLREEQRAAEAE